MTTDVFEKANWPCRASDEISSDFFEDLRKRIWLIEGYPERGYKDIYTGRLVYTHTNWGLNDKPLLHYAGPPYCEPKEPGSLEVWFCNPVTGQVKRYSNYNWVYADYLSLTWWGTYTETANPNEFSHFNIYAKSGLDWSNCPVNKNGTTNPNWREVPDPNRYHHWDYNSGRWVIKHCQGDKYISNSSYDAKMPAHYWLPRQTDPLEQIQPTGTRQMDYDDPPVCERRHRPVEFKKAFIDQWLAGQGLTSCGDGKWSRCISANYYPRSHNGGGVHPLQQSIFGPYKAHPFDRRLAELGMSMGYWSRKMGNLQWGAAGIDDVVCAYQDRTAFTIDSFGHSRYVSRAGSKYIEQFKKRWEAWFGRGAWTDDTTYSRGSVVTNDGTKYICITAHNNAEVEETEPGVGADWADYWATGVWRPDWFGEHCDWPQLGDDFWNENGSAFEMVLAQIGTYDWWWDDVTPVMPNRRISAASTYTTYEARWREVWANIDVPGSGDPELFPKPSGCWRRTWRYSMGKVIKEGGQEAAMWPSELGDPREFFNITKGQFIIDSARGINISDIDPPHRQYYQIVSVGKMLNKVAQILTDTEPSSGKTYQKLLDERHGPVQTINGVDEYELKRTLLNQMRYALMWLRHIRIDDLVTVDQGVKVKLSYAAGTGGGSYPTAIEAVHGGNWRAAAGIGGRYKKRAKPWNGNEIYVSTGYRTGRFRMAPGDWAAYVDGASPLQANGIWIVGEDDLDTNMLSDGSVDGKWQFSNSTGIPENWRVGDFITINPAAVGARYVTEDWWWTHILSIPDANHIVVDVDYPDKTGYFVLHRWKAWTGGSDRIRLRIWYKRGDTTSKKDEGCKIGILDETLKPPDNPTLIKIGYLICEREASGRATIFEAEIFDPWPGHSPSDPAYVDLANESDWSHDWSRITACMFSTTAPDGYTLENHIITEVDWSRYVSEAPYDMFKLDCSNVR